MRRIRYERIVLPGGHGLLLRAVHLIAENLREFTYDRMNSKACENMAAAATMGGIAIGFGAGAGIVHGLGHQISACPKGLGRVYGVRPIIVVL